MYQRAFVHESARESLGGVATFLGLWGSVALGGGTTVHEDSKCYPMDCGEGYPREPAVHCYLIRGSLLTVAPTPDNAVRVIKSGGATPDVRAMRSIVGGAAPPLRCCFVWPCVYREMRQNHRPSACFFTRFRTSHADARDARAT